MKYLRLVWAPISVLFFVHCGSDSEGSDDGGRGGSDAGGMSGIGGDGGESTDTGGSGGTSGPGGSAGSGNQGGNGASGGDGDTGGEAGAAEGGSGGNGASGGDGGGIGEDDPECVRPTVGIPVIDEAFDSDIFSGSWTRSDGSVTVDGGLLKIGADASNDDYAEFPLNFTALPAFLEIRARVVSGNAVLPLVTLMYTSAAGIYLTSGSEPASWQFMGDGFPVGPQLPGWDADVGDWITARAFINVGGGTLCAKRESDTHFLKIVTSSWSSTATSLQRLRLRQHFDEVVEIDSVLLTRP